MLEDIKVSELRRAPKSFASDSHASSQNDVQVQIFLHTLKIAALTRIEKIVHAEGFCEGFSEGVPGLSINLIRLWKKSIFY